MTIKLIARRITLSIFALTTIICGSSLIPAYSQPSAFPSSFDVGNITVTTSPSQNNAVTGGGTLTTGPLRFSLFQDFGFRKTYRSDEPSTWSYSGSWTQGPVSIAETGGPGNPQHFLQPLFIHLNQNNTFSIQYINFQVTQIVTNPSGTSSYQQVTRLGDGHLGGTVAVNSSSLSFSQTTDPACYCGVGGSISVTTSGFSGVPRVTATVQTNPAGRSFTVDGVTYNSTQTFNWQSGAAHTIGTTSPQTGSNGTQHVWSNWSDSGAISHTVSPTGNVTYTANFTTSIYDLSVEKVEPVQVVYGDDVKLVQGKETAVRVTVKTTNVAQLKSDSNIPSNIKVEVEFEGTMYPKTFNKNDFDTNGLHNFVINPKIIPQSINTKEFTVRVDPENSITESDKDNNKKLKTISVVSTGNINLSYMPINGCLGFANNCYLSPPTDVHITAAVTNSFIKSTYPIAPNNFSGTVSSVNGKGTTQQGEAGVRIDLTRLATIAKYVGFSHVFGVVSKDYWRWHSEVSPKYSNVVGVAFRNSRGGITTDIAEDGSIGDGSIGAHEFGHMFGGLRDEYSYPTIGPIYDGNPSDDGFWVSNNIDRDNSKRPPIDKILCLMSGTSPHNKWVEKSHYIDFIKKLSSGTNNSSNRLFEESSTNDESKFDSRYSQSKFEKISTNSEYLVISALVNQNGAVTVLPWFTTTNSESVDTNDPTGNYKVKLLTSSGQVISEVAVPIEFIMYAEPVGAIATDTAPLVVKVPYSPNVASVQILKDNQPVRTIDISGKLLRDTVNAIPNLGFNGNAATQRADLLGKVDVFESRLTLGNREEARQLLITQIKPSVQQGLSEGYAIEAVLELTKPQVISVIDGEIARLQGPTAASVSISGKVTMQSGRGIRNVKVTLTDSKGNQQWATTNSFGYYHFENVMAGETVILTAQSKRYSFKQSTRIISVNDDLSDVDFVAEQ